MSAPNKSAAQDSKMHLMGTDFLSACSHADPEWIGFCHGYVQAVVARIFAHRLARRRRTWWEPWYDN
jgi:hypothetical protein